MTRMRLRHVSLAVIAVFAVTGCTRKLETGYTPRKLSDTPAERRAYYAPRFTPEAAAGTDREDELANRRARPGY